MSMSVVATLAVIPILVGPDQGLGLSAIRAELDAVTRWRPAIAVISLDDQAELNARECGGDLSCWADAVKPYGASHAILLVVNTGVVPPHVAVRALDVRARAIVGEESGAASGALEVVVRERVAVLLDALGFREAGRIVVKRDREEAAIEVSPAPLAAIGVDQFWVVPGKYRVTVVEGERRVAADVDVAGGVEREVSLVLAEPVVPIVESAWLWAGVGAGVVVIASVIVVAALGRGTDVCLGRGDCP